MLWIMEAEVFSWIDHGSAGKRCRDLDSMAFVVMCAEKIRSLLRLFFCHYLCLVLRLAKARLPLDGDQEHVAA